MVGPFGLDLGMGSYDFQEWRLETCCWPLGAEELPCVIASRHPPPPCCIYVYVGFCPRAQCP